MLFHIKSSETRFKFLCCELKLHFVLNMAIIYTSEPVEMGGIFFFFVHLP